MSYSRKLSLFAGPQCKRGVLPLEQIKHVLYYHWNDNKNEVIFLALMDPRETLF